MEKGGGSRLMQMQARFQQKQMQEREMKIANLYEAQQARALDRVRHSPSNGVRNPPNNGISSNGSSISSPPQSVPHQPGKVRQMFEERRTKAGIDKSYPLQPIHNTDRTRKALPNGYSKVTATSNSTSRISVEKRTSKTHTSHAAVSSQSIKKVHHKTEHIVNSSGDLNHNHEPDLNSLRQALPQSNGEPSTDEVDRNENNYLIENETFPDALAPAQTPRSPEPVAPPRQEVKAPPRRAPVARTSPPKAKPQPHARSPTRRVVSENAVTETSRKGVMQRGPSASSAATRNPVQSPRSNAGASPTKTRSTVGAHGSGAGAGGAGEACAICGRKFASDRLAKHQEICKKAHSKKRKPFDALKHRLAGTEAEPFINKLRKNTTNPSSTKVKALNSSWRQKHEDFIQAIRNAKQVQAHLARGGKLSDLPPPPPSENPDYVSCPSCGRRFNQGAAERHIPKCKNYQFNKPKPAAKRR